MVSIKNIIFIFAILVSSTLTLAQGPDSNDSSSNEVGPPQENSNGSSEESNDFIFRGTNHDWSHFTGAGFFAQDDTRQKRAADRRVIRCDYASEGGFRCTGCHTVRRCYPFGRGTESTCTGLFQYCNNGQCSRTKGSMCSDTTSTSTSSTSTTESSSTSTSSTTGSSSTTDSSSTTGSSSTSGSSTT